MELMKNVNAEDRACGASRDHRLTRARTLKPGRSSNLLEAIAQLDGGEAVSSSGRGGDGVVRMKILVKKQDLKQVMEAMRGGVGGKSIGALANTSMALEQRLNVMRRRQLLRAGRRSSWRPVLQSIPEEL